MKYNQEKLIQEKVQNLIKIIYLNVNIMKLFIVDSAKYN